jgi:hypothetical protein
VPAVTLTEKIMISFSANFANDQVWFGAFAIAAVGHSRFGGEGTIASRNGSLAERSSESAATIESFVKNTRQTALRI